MSETDDKKVRERDPRALEAREAKALISQMMPWFDSWRERAAVLQVLVNRAGTDKKSILAECASIRAQLTDARTELILNLAEAPPPVAGHSRVVDVEKAIDSLEEALRRVEWQARS